MSRTKRIVIAAALVALAAAPAIALAGSTRSVANSTSYPDSVGEDAQAPDITSTTVSNDDTGLITFHVAISNRPDLTDDMLLELDLDTDNNPATGDAQGLVPGTDYLIQLTAGAVSLFKWSGTDYPSTTAPSLVYAYDATGATIRINAKGLGNTRVVNFGSLVISGLTVDASGNLVTTGAHADFSPDQGHGAFTYRLEIKVSLSVISFTTTPKPVKAGKPFSAGVAVNESDTDSGIEQGAITCSARLAGKTLRVVGKRLLNGVAVCVWNIPKTAKGKRLQGSIAVSTQGAQVSRSFSLKVA